MSAITTIDTKGFSCPQPVLMVNAYLIAKDTSPLHILVDNEASLENVSRAAKKHGWNVQIENIDENVQKIIATL